MKTLVSFQNMIWRPFSFLPYEKCSDLRNRRKLTLKSRKRLYWKYCSSPLRKRRNNYKGIEYLRKLEMEEKGTWHNLLQSFKRGASYLGHTIVLGMNQHHAVKRTLVFKISDAEATRGLLV